MNAFYRITEQAGNALIRMLHEVWGLFVLLCETVGAASSLGRKGRRSLYKQVSGQILFTGVEALGLVAVIALLCGVTIVFQAMTNMPQIGIGEYFGKILNMAVVRELGPFFTALVVIGRSGTALATYIGNMRVSKEVAALEVMGVDPVHFLVVPAFWGMVISITCLNVYFAIIAIGGGILLAYMAGATSGIPFPIFFGRVLEALLLQDIMISVLKGVAFGAIVATVSCYYGLRVQNIRQVPQASISSVVVSMVGMIGVNIMAAVVVYTVYA